MLKAIKGLFSPMTSSSSSSNDYLYYDNASSVSDWSNASWIGNSTGLAAQGQQSQLYAQKLQAWQNIQSMGNWGYAATSLKEVDRQLLEQVRHRGEHYASKLLLEVGCA